MARIDVWAPHGPAAFAHNSHNHTTRGTCRTRKAPSRNKKADDMPPAQSQTVRGAEIIAAIKRSGISTIVALPDIVWLWLL